MSAARVSALCWRLDVPQQDGEAPATGQGTILIVASMLAIRYQDRWIVGKHLNAERAQQAALEWTKTLEVRYGATLSAGPVSFFLSKSQADELRASGAELPEGVLALLNTKLSEASLAPAS